VLIAKKRSALLALQEQLRQRGGDQAMHKTYAALVLGAWPRAARHRRGADKFLTGDGERPSRPSRRPRRRPPFDHAGAHRAAVRCLYAARRHDQDRSHAPDRVHLTHEGHAIVGDERYGDFALTRRSPAARPCPASLRPACSMHERRLRFTHPERRGDRARSPLPAECEH